MSFNYGELRTKAEAIVQIPEHYRLAAGGVMLYDRGHITFENGIIISVMPMWNHSVFLTAPECVSSCEANAVIVETAHDLYTAAGIDAAEPNPLSLTDLAEARRKVSFSIFIPTVVPAGWQISRNNTTAHST
jgi:hypothetical protein